MNPIYKFELNSRQTFPVYKDDLEKEFEQEQNQQFFRGKLTGKLIFTGPDYAWIVAQVFDFQFLLTIYISYNGGNTWSEYWNGTFWKTDCEFDDDSESVTVTPTVHDQYNDVLAGLEKEYNLIDLLPEIVQVRADKRPMIQVYVPGQSSIGCFLSGMWWEEECTAIDNESDLVNKYYFALNRSERLVEVTGEMQPAIPEVFVGTPPASDRTSYEYTNGEYKFSYQYVSTSQGQSTTWAIIRVSDNVTLWQYQSVNQDPPTPPNTITLDPVGTGVSGTVELYIHDVKVYARYLLDVTTIAGQNTYALPDDDLVGNNRNYHRAIGYAVSNVIFFSQRFSDTPTQWGLYEPGKYYQQPASIGISQFYPVARNGWGKTSIWFAFSAFDWIAEQQGRAAFTLRDAFPLSSVISVLLGQIAPGITHGPTTDYSSFLYGQTNPISGIAQTLMITPKSNIISAGYDQPAQKAPITLKWVLDMLRDCFRCYWFIDGQNRFRIEHIRYFMNGGSYSGTPVVGIDLTQQKVSRNGKEWAFARNQYEYDKPDMAARYQFGWMDDVTQLFEGYPIDIISKYVNPDNIENIDVTQFTSDIDFVLLNPNAISKDGFILMAGQDDNYLTEPEIMDGNAGGSRIFTFDFTAFIGRTITIRIASTVAGLTVGQTDYTNYDIIGTIDAAETGQTFTYVVTRPRLAVWGASANFAVNLSAIYGLSYKLPYVNFRINGTDYNLQNGYVAFAYLQQYYAYDMPARQYSINGVSGVALGIKKLKKQTLRFPTLTDPNLYQLIKTNLGNGAIEKLSINLSSRNANATLKYDTE